MSRLTSAQWRLGRQVLDVLGAEPGMTDSAIADRLGVSTTVLRPVLGMLLGRGRLERCGSYLVAATPAAAAEDGAA